MPISRSVSMLLGSLSSATWKARGREEREDKGEEEKDHSCPLTIAGYFARRKNASMFSMWNIWYHSFPEFSTLNRYKGGSLSLYGGRWTNGRVSLERVTSKGI